MIILTKGNVIHAKRPITGRGIRIPINRAQFNKAVEQLGNLLEKKAVISQGGSKKLRRYIKF